MTMEKYPPSHKYDATKGITIVAHFFAKA